MKIEDLQLVKRIFEAALMAADKPLQRKELVALFDELEKPEDALIDEALEVLSADCEGRGYELKRVASGYRYQVSQDLSAWVSKLWQERAPRYSRALLETLSLVAYRQPITRGEIEEIRGVAVSTQIIKTLLEREWVKVVGHRDVPGHPAIYATTRQFLDYFNLKSLDQLPPLAEIRDLNTISKEFNIELPLELAGADVDQLPEDEAANDGEVNDGNASEEGNSVSAAESVESFSGEASVAEQSAAEPAEDAAIVDEVAAFESWIDDGLVDDATEDTNDEDRRRVAELHPASTGDDGGDQSDSQADELTEAMELEASGDRQKNTNNPVEF